MTHRATRRAKLDRIHVGEAPSIAILVPSYKEDPNIVRQTLLAAALQGSPKRRIILLIDDPPFPRNQGDEANLARARNLPREINMLFAAPYRRFGQALTDFEQRKTNGCINPGCEVKQLAALLHEAADWLDALADGTAVNTHTDALFVKHILRAPARSHRRRERELTAARRPERVNLVLEYRRLAALFRVEVTSFERKRYANLSHEPNKAMNLNSYLGLMGKSFREVASPNGPILEQTDDRQATLRAPNTDFIIVLDADSLILSEYSLRLVHFMTRPENERVAVAQTPYASIPGAVSMTERIAGAMTDV